MKKLATLLLLIVSFLSKSSIAQNTACTAEFNVTYQTSNTVQFNPLMPGDPLNTQHYWIFGDGAVDNTVSPVHTYLSSGAFTAKHIIIRFYNGVEICRDSFYRVIQIQTPNPTPCNLIANFTITPITATPNAFYFQNTSTPINTTDSVHWTFGDGTSSTNFNPTHTYLQSGTYTVCLRVQQRTSSGTLTNCIREICQTIVVQIPTTCNLVANFTFALLAGSINTYHFENTSVPLHNTDSIRWTFGDGTSSNEVSPNHTYTQAGTYTVCLRIQQREPNGTLSNCVREICHTIVVQIPTTCNLVANFTFTLLTTAPGFTYHFENTSVPLNSTDSIRWTFGDGTSSNQVSPNHTYTQPGTYNVCLRIQQRGPNGTLSNCVREICHTIIVQGPTTCNLVASFTSTLLSSVPFTFHFENTSTPLNANDSIRWTFGDGTSSNEISPNHTYTQPGTYTVCLRVQKRTSIGTPSNCISEICHTVVVPTTCNIQAHFTWSVDQQNNLKIIFTNNTISSTTAATAIWNFGDGTTATTWNAVHEYAHPGRYYVCLRVQASPNCVSYSCDSITVPPPVVNCTQQSNFSILAAAGNSQLFYFIPNNINNAWQYTWTFGDGTGSHDITTSHYYPHPGNYTACLTVYRDANCASTTCKPVNVAYQVNCDSVHVTYSYQATAAFPNKLYFQAISNFPILDQTWTITRLPATSTNPPVTLHQNNPYYIFNDTGYYRVCLRAVTLGGCIKEYCQVIHIAQVITTNACTLQPYPNPGSSSISVNVFLTLPQMIDVYIYNSMNLLVKEKHQPGLTGNNIVTIAIGDLVAGTYTMKVIHGNDVCYAQFVKL